MGLTPIDLFNDILVTEQDLRTFLWQNSIEHCSTSLPGMIIQAYITFCEKANTEIWTSSKLIPNYSTVAIYNPDNTANDEDVLYQHVMDLEEDDESDASDESDAFVPATADRKKSKSKRRSQNAESKRLGRPPKEKPKEKTLSDTKKRELELLELVRAACDVCQPTLWQQGAMDFFKTGNQTDLDRVSSRHKLEEHNIRDTTQQERELLKELEGKYAPLPDKVLIDGFQRMRCREKDCDAYFTASKPYNYYLHCEYHDQLRSQQRTFRPNFPCIDCPQSFSFYNELADHVDQHHPRFLYKCPVPDCSYRAAEYQKRQSHYNMVHRPSLYQNIVHTCEVNTKMARYYMI